MEGIHKRSQGITRMLTRCQDHLRTDPGISPHKDHSMGRVAEENRTSKIELRKSNFEKPATSDEPHRPTTAHDAQGNSGAPPADAFRRGERPHPPDTDSLGRAAPPPGHGLSGESGPTTHHGAIPQHRPQMHSRGGCDTTLEEARPGAPEGAGGAQEGPIARAI